jgi:hypothetical protein
MMEMTNYLEMLAMIFYKEELVTTTYWGAEGTMF